MSLVIGLAGSFYALSGIALLLAPAWFYTYVGWFPPFNRHYLGDLGSFLLPLGVGLLLAARDPARHRLLVIVAAAGSLLHAVNHGVDDVVHGVGIAHLTGETLALLAFSLLLLGVLPMALRRPA